MLISNHEQLWRLFCYLGFGVFAGIYLSVFYALRRISPISKRLIFVHDCLFCVGVTVMLFLFSLAVEGGHLRSVSFASTAVGAACSYTLLRRPITAVIVLIFGVFRVIGQRIERIASFSAKKLVFFCKKSYIFLKKVLHSLHIVVYNHKE